MGRNVVSGMSQRVTLGVRNSKNFGLQPSDPRSSRPFRAACSCILPASQDAQTIRPARPLADCFSILLDSCRGRTDKKGAELCRRRLRSVR
jgi:hypothetical protein